MHKVEQDLYIGDVDDVDDTKYLKDKKIDVIVNLSSWTPSREDYNDFTWINIPLKDGHGNQHSFDTAVENVVREMQKNCTLLVNCAAGVSRSATVLATALASSRGMEFEEALRQIEEERPIVNPNKGIINNGKNFLQKTKFTTASTK